MIRKISWSIPPCCLRYGRRHRLWAIVSILSVVAILSACVTTPESKQQTALYFPPPPSQPRFVYQLDLRSPASLISRADNWWLNRRHSTPKQRTVFSKPFDVAAGNGRIFVSDTVAQVIHAFDVPRGAYYRIGTRDNGKLIRPLGIAVDGKERVYVADSTSRRVYVYDTLGLYLKQIGGPEFFHNPRSVAVDATGEKIYVIENGGVDDVNHQVIAFNGEGKYLFTIGNRGNGAGEFNLPVDAAVGPDDTLYVLDAGNFRVQAFNANGHFLRQWGKVGTQFGNFARPRQIAVDRSGKVYVSDAFFGNVQIFSPQGQLLMSVGKFGTTDKPGNFAVAGGVAVDEIGHLYILDQFFRKVEIFGRLPTSDVSAFRTANPAGSTTP